MAEQTITKTKEIILDETNFKKLKEDALNQIVSHFTQTADLFETVENMQREIAALKENISKMPQGVIAECLIIGDEKAIELIKKYLAEKKIARIYKISIADIAQDLRLPVEQIENIMNSLKSHGVREVD